MPARRPLIPIRHLKFVLRNSLPSFSQCRPPALILLQQFLPGAALTIGHSGAVTVLPSHLEFRNDKLPVPGRLSRRGRPSSARRMGETDSIGSVEHDQVLMGTKNAVIERIAEAQRRKAFVEHRPGVRRELQLGLVSNVANGALIIVRLGAELDPALVITEINGLVLRSINVAGPEEPDVTVGKD